MTPAELAEQFTNLVYVTARETFRRHPWDDREELISDGMVGLMQAAERFDPTCGATFAGFAGPRIKGAMIDGIRSRHPGWRQGRPIRFVEITDDVETASQSDPLDRLALAELLNLVDSMPADLRAAVGAILGGATWLPRKRLAELRSCMTRQEGEWVFHPPVRVCVNGHPVNSLNEYRGADGFLRCRICRNDAARRARAGRRKTLRAKRKFCAKGHRFTPETVKTFADGHRECLICRRERRRIQRAQTERRVA